MNSISRKISWNRFHEKYKNVDYNFQAPLGIDNLIPIDEPTRRKVFEHGQRGGGGVDSKTEGGPDGSATKGKKIWGVGEMEFEAMMRMLDNAVSFLDITIRYIIHILLYIVVYIINSERKIYCPLKYKILWSWYSFTSSL